jgi:GDPmannose 4,6-dehydratase
MMPHGNSGENLRKEPAEVRRVVEAVAPSDWVFDFETASGHFCAWVGRLIVHNSPRREETFVTRKITLAAARIKAGLQNKLILGNLDAKRDWGYAPEYVEAMWLMLQQNEPDDYVIATGETHSVIEFLGEAFGCVGLDWTRHVRFDPEYIRPAEVDELRGDASKAKAELGWEAKTKFPDLVRLMVDADAASVRGSSL